MPRFFVEQPPEGQVFLGGEDGRHIAKSLRMRPGEALTLCDGRGRDYACVVVSCREDGALVQVEGSSPSAGEPETQGSLEKFQDAGKVGNWAKEAITWAVEEGIIDGMTPTTLEPTGTATRAQAAAMLQRFLEG